MKGREDGGAEQRRGAARRQRAPAEQRPGRGREGGDEEHAEQQLLVDPGAERDHQAGPPIEAGGARASVCSSPSTPDVTPPTTIPNASASSSDSPSMPRNTQRLKREPWARASRATSHRPPPMRQVMNSSGPQRPATAVNTLCKITSAPLRTERGPAASRTART